MSTEKLAPPRPALDIETLLRIVRFQYLTLGYYGTPYNYDDKNIVHHPISGEPASGIKWDGGKDAREAGVFIKGLLGDDPVKVIDETLFALTFNEARRAASRIIQDLDNAIPREEAGADRG